MENDPLASSLCQNLTTVITAVRKQKLETVAWSEKMVVIFFFFFAHLTKYNLNSCSDLSGAEGELGRACAIFHSTPGKSFVPHLSSNIYFVEFFLEGVSKSLPRYKSTMPR